MRDFYAFGDFLSLSGDLSSSSCGWIGATNANDASSVYFSFSGAQIGGNIAASTEVKGYMVKPFNGTGTLKPLVLSSDGSSTIATSGRFGAVSNFPNPTTQSIIGLPVYVLTDEYLRAKFPALLFIPQHLNDNYTLLDKLVSNNVLVMAANGEQSSGNNGFFAFDLKG